MAVDQHLRWAAEASEDRQGPSTLAAGTTRPHHERVVHQPVGVVAAITGYNYPLNLAIFKFGAALAAGAQSSCCPRPGPR